MPIIRAIAASIILCLPAGIASAEMLRDLYAASVAVDERTETALAAGAREALSVVFVKVSGSREVLQYPVIRSALGGARDEVQQYAFERDGGAGDRLLARFEFDSDWVTRQVVAAGAPLWTANRPTVLLWLVVEDAAGRRFVTPDSQPETVQLVAGAFAERGVPVTMPLHDLTDSSALTPDDVWRLDAIALRSASTRYGVQHIAAGRFLSLSSGELVGDWSYLGPHDRLDRSVTAANAAEFAKRGATIVADDMASRYAVAVSADGESGIDLAVTGVTGYADYAAIVSWLQRLELVQHANIERISGDRLELRLHASADAAQLERLIGLNQRLQPVAAPTAGPRLSYQWLK